MQWISLMLGHSWVRSLWSNNIQIEYGSQHYEWFLWTYGDWRYQTKYKSDVYEQASHWHWL